MPDHLIGASKQSWWNSEAHGLSCLEIDDQLKFGRLFDWKVSRIRAV